MSINQLFEISRRSMRALDAAMNTAGDNVANASTPGFSRRRVTFRPESVASRGVIMRTPYGTATGVGVSVQSYERMRDGLLAASTNTARAGLGAAQEEQRLLGALEGLFPTGAGSISNLLSDFWDGWSTLADHPTDTGVRVALRSRATALTDALHRAAGDLGALKAGAEADLSAHVESVNGLLGEIAALNETAEAARLQGSPDLAAEDRRDQLVQELSDFVPVRVRPDGPAGYTISVDGMTLVQGRTVMPFALDLSGATPALTFGDTQVPYQPPAGADGRIGAALRTLTDTIPSTQSSLDNLAATLVAEVNALHQTGYGLDGATGRAFFDPAGASAATLRLDAAITADADAIAASSDPTAAGDNDVALALAALREQKLLGGGTETPGTFVANLLAGIGSRLSDVAGQAAGQAAVVDHLHAMERGVSGVSLDEEMTKLIEYQQAFAASARVLSTAQSMMDTLLAL